MKFFVFLFLGVCLAFPIKSISQSIGARAAGMAHTSITNHDVYAASNNVAATAFLHRHQLGIYAQNKYLIPEISDISASYVFSDDTLGAFSSSLSYFGYNAFHTSELSLGYARKFGSQIAAGLKFNYHNITIQENGTKHLVSMQMSLYYAALEQVNFAVVLDNPIKQQFSKGSKESLSTTISIGANYNPSEKIQIALQFTKALQYPSQISLGVEYQIHDILLARFGTGIYPTIVSGGIGLKLKSFNVDFASTWHQNLNYSPQLSIQYNFGK
jgi:hypothetical protein